jgi:hypothetical protein
MFRRILVSCTGFAFVVFLAASAGAQPLEGVVEELKRRVSVLEQKVEEASSERKTFKERMEEAIGVKISGFVDTSFFWNANTGDLATGNGTAEDASFSLDQVELDLEKEISDWLSVRTDLDFEQGDGTLTADEILEQGFVVVTFPTISALDEDGWDIVVGKFNAPIGWELLDPPDMYQFSHSITFNYGLPTNLTGVMLRGNITRYIDFALYGVNGWDVSDDNNRDKTIGGRLGLTIFDENLNVGVSAIHGPESAPRAVDPAEALAAATGGQDNHDQRTVLDVDYTINLPILEGVVIGGEVNLGREEHAESTFLVLPGRRPADAEWFGFFNTIHVDILSWLGLTYRYDYFDDSSGARIHMIPQIWQSHTGALTLALADGAGFLVEYRFDKSNLSDMSTAPFVKKDGRRDDENSTVAAEFTYTF